MTADAVDVAVAVDWAVVFADVAVAVVTDDSVDVAAAVDDDDAAVVAVAAALADADTVADLDHFPVPAGPPLLHPVVASSTLLPDMKPVSRES